jgi:hypothetical protein
MELLKHLKLAEFQYNSRSFTHIETFLRHKIVSSTGKFRRTEGNEDIRYNLWTRSDSQFNGIQVWHHCPVA